MRALQCLFLILALTAGLFAKDLKIYVIVVEGGKATLIVSPKGESLLVDTGWPGFRYAPRMPSFMAPAMSGSMSP